DRFAIVNWSRIFQTQWEYTIDRDLIITKDSGVALWWNPILLQPGQTRTYVTFLGLGAMPPDTEPPYIQNQQPKKNATAVALNTPIQFEVLDDYMGVDSASIALHINGHSVQPKIAGSLSKYTVSYQPVNAFHYNDTISVEIDASDLAVRPNRMPTERYQFYLVRDTLAPEIKNLYPLPNARHVPRDTSMSFVLYDRHSGLDTNSIAVYVNDQPIQFSLEPKINEYWIRHRFLPPFGERDEVRVRIVANDQVRPPNTLDSAFTFVIMPDTLPPRIEYYSPQHQSREIVLDSMIVIHLVDDFSGVNRQSIRFLINGQPVVPNINGDSSRFIITYLPEQGYHYNQQINVGIEASDQAKQANHMPLFEFSFWTVTDTLPPAIVAMTPAPEDTNVNPLPRFLIDMTDDRSGIDSSSIRLWVNNQRVPFKLTGNPLAYRIAYQPDHSFAYLTWIPVKIEACDRSYPPNDMVPFDAKVRVMREKDRTPPRTEQHRPNRWATGVALKSDISFHILDDQSGVDSSSIILKVNQQVVYPKIEGHPNEYTVTFQPPRPFWYGETVAIEIEAQDLAPDTVNVMPTERYTFTILRDTIAPVIDWLAPGQPGTHIPLDAEFRAQITDELTGIDLESLVFAFRGQVERPTISGNSAICQLDFKPTVPMKYNEQVEVLVKVRDRATPPNRNVDTLFTFFTTEDYEPPYVLSCFPANEARGLDFDTEIEIRLNDDVAGVDVRSIVMMIDNVAVEPEISGTPQSYTLRYRPSGGFRPGQEVTVRIAAADLSNPANRMQEYHFRFFILVILPNISIPSFTSDLQQLMVHRSATVSARVRVDTAPVFDPIQVQLWDNRVLVMDTTLIIHNKDEEHQIKRSLIFHTKDRHELMLRVDPRNVISESREDDNVATIPIDVAEGALIVRSNPFTPNGDGINDVVTFNFEQLSVASPSLKLFDVSGRLILTMQQSEGYSFVWDGRDRFGNPAPPGAYLYLLHDRDQIIANGYVVLAR
ncbi:MAG: Ig-like domain-containing protein, partial [candidate division KSB1 bacterium]|nr:Ig-like domain-containing protein [candidate division KSB1 bacterium]